MSGEKPEKKSNQSVFSWTLAVIVGQVGCVTLVIIFAALFLGIWLDNLLSTKPIFTVGLIVASIPVTMVAMILIVRATTSRFTQEISIEEENSEDAGEEIEVKHG